MLKQPIKTSLISRADLAVVTGLILFGTIPVAAGIARLAQIFIGAQTLENARFHSSPIPAVLHITAAIIYSWLGAFQFSNGFRARFTRLHRQFGKGLIVSGLVASVTGIWMTLYYPAANHDGPIVFFVRLIVGAAMTAFILFGIDSIRRRQFVEHGHWMLRAYALGLGAATQVLTHLPWFIFPQIQGEAARALFMTLGWVINAIVAEWIIHKTKTNKRKQYETI